VCIRREFSHKLVGDRILKICSHLPKLLSNIKWLNFFGTHCIYVTLPLAVTTATAADAAVDARGVYSI